MEIKWRTEDLAKLSYDSRQQLTRLLYPTAIKDWRSLADALGFSDGDIGYFGMAREECVKQLLHSYEGREGASMPALYAAIIKIGRHDAAEVLNPYVSRGFFFLSLYL